MNHWISIKEPSMNYEISFIIHWLSIEYPLICSLPATDYHHQWTMRPLDAHSFTIQQWLHSFIHWLKSPFVDFALPRSPTLSSSSLWGKPWASLSHYGAMDGPSLKVGWLVGWLVGWFILLVMDLSDCDHERGSSITGVFCGWLIVWHGWNIIFRASPSLGGTIFCGMAGFVGVSFIGGRRVPTSCGLLRFRLA